MSQQLCFELLAEQMISLWISHQPRCCGFLSIQPNAQIAGCTDSFLNILGNSNDQSLFRVSSALATTTLAVVSFQHMPSGACGHDYISFTSGLIRQLPACPLGGHTHVTSFKALFANLLHHFSHQRFHIRTLYSTVSSSR